MIETARDAASNTYPDRDLDFVSAYSVIGYPFFDTLKSNSIAPLKAKML